MAVSKRLRYEVLRRDGHTCRYCGAAAPDALLRIDHVTPVALGGTDTADNLVTACEPCNSGKTSTTPDSALVAQVADDAVRWGAAMERAAQNLAAAEQPKQDYADAFFVEWKRWESTQAVLPRGWATSIERFRVAGLPAFVWAEVVDTAMGQAKVPAANKFAYCCGIARNKVASLHADARNVLRGKQALDAEVDALYDGAAPSSWKEADFWRAAAEGAWAHAWTLKAGGDSPPTADYEVFIQERGELESRGYSMEEIVCASVHAGTLLTAHLTWGLAPADARLAPISGRQYDRIAGVHEQWLETWRELHGDSPSESMDNEFGGRLILAMREGRTRDELLRAARSTAMARGANVDYFAFHVAIGDEDEDGA